MLNLCGIGDDKPFDFSQPITAEQQAAADKAFGGASAPASTGFWSEAKQAASLPFEYSTSSGEESSYQQAYDTGVQLTPAQQQVAASYGITGPSAAAKAYMPLFKASLLQPSPVAGQTALQNVQTQAQQQSLNPALYAQMQAAAAQQAAVPGSNKTLLIIGGAIIGLAILYFMFKDKR